MELHDANEALLRYARRPVPSLPPKSELGPRRDHQQELPVVDGDDRVVASAMYARPLASRDHPTVGSLGQRLGIIPPHSSSSGSTGTVPAWGATTGTGTVTGTSTSTSTGMGVGPAARSHLPSASSLGDVRDPRDPRDAIESQHHGLMPRLAPPLPPPPVSVHILLGSTISSAYLCRDLDGELGIFFALPDLSVREEGRYRLVLTLASLGHDDMVSEGVSPVVLSMTTPEFSSYLHSLPPPLPPLFDRNRRMPSLHPPSSLRKRNR